MTEKDLGPIDQPYQHPVLSRAIERLLHRTGQYRKSAWRFAVISFSLIIFSPLAVQGQGHPLDIQSKAFAEASARLLDIGQKRAAIITALKGLPEPFT